MDDVGTSVLLLDEIEELLPAKFENDVKQLVFMLIEGIAFSLSFTFVDNPVTLVYKEKSTKSCWVKCFEHTYATLGIKSFLPLKFSHCCPRSPVNIQGSEICSSREESQFKTKHPLTIVIIIITFKKKLNLKFLKIYQGNHSNFFLAQKDP